MLKFNKNTSHITCAPFKNGKPYFLEKENAVLMGLFLETKSKIKCLLKLGIDAVGMPTIPEVIMAKFLKIKVFGISYIRNTGNYNVQDGKEFVHTKGFEKEVITAKRFAAIIENIFKKA
jgi:purine-nucleoside phosphorylase